MAPWLRNVLLFAGGLYMLKLFDDSRVLIKRLRERAGMTAPTTNIGGKQLPIPSGGNSGASQTTVTNEAALSAANPNTAYGDEYM